MKLTFVRTSQENQITCGDIGINVKPMPGLSQRVGTFKYNGVFGGYNYEIEFDADNEPFIYEAKTGDYVYLKEYLEVEGFPNFFLLLYASYLMKEECSIHILNSWPIEYYSGRYIPN